MQMAANVIHQNAPGVLATVGSATPYWVSQWQGLGLDFYDFHYYPTMDWGNPPGTGLPTYASLNLDKPCIVGEYPSVVTDVNIGSRQPLSAQWYLDTIKNYGYAGSYVWAASFNDGTAAYWVPFQPVFTHWAAGF